VDDDDSASLVHGRLVGKRARVPLRFQIGLALVAQDHLGMEFILTMARHVIVILFRDSSYETKLYISFLLYVDYFNNQ
jgi:hypothetical protein